MKPLRVGIIGLGFGQRVLVPAFQLDRRYAVTALCATSVERARAAARSLGVPHAYGDWQAMVAAPDLDVIAVATPPAVQPDIIRAALAQRKHVFCEKPLATTREAAQALLAAARQAGVAHMVDFEFPEAEEWRRAKTFLERGTLGALRHAVVSWQMETYANRAGLSSWKTRADMGGGTLNLFVSHTFSYMEWLLGPVRCLSARLFPAGAEPESDGNDTLAVLCLVMENGMPVSVTVSAQALFGNGHVVEVYGERASFVLENRTPDYVRGFTLRYGERGQSALAELPVEAWQSREGDGRIGAVARLVQRLADWIETGRPSRPSLEEGYRVQCLLEAARESSETKRWVDVSAEAVSCR